MFHILQDYLPGKHYDAYNPKQGLHMGTAKAIEWFERHLGKPMAKL